MNTNLPLYRCSIDESGDEGLTPRSRPFFFVTAVVNAHATTSNIVNTMDIVKQRIWGANYSSLRPLHWRDMKHPQRTVSIREIAGCDLVVISVGIWKTQLKYLKDREQLYNLAVRYLLERVSWYVSEQNGYVKVTFGDRSNLRINEIRSYVDILMNQRNSQIRPVFDPQQIAVVKTAKQPLLQVADICAGALSNAFNPDNYGETHHQFLYEICKRLYRSKQGKLMGYGIKIFPDKEFSDSRGSEFRFMDVVNYILSP